MKSRKRRVVGGRWPFGTNKMSTWTNHWNVTRSRLRNFCLTSQCVKKRSARDNAKPLATPDGAAENASKSPLIAPRISAPKRNETAAEMNEPINRVEENLTTAANITVQLAQVLEATVEIAVQSAAIAENTAELDAANAARLIKAHELLKRSIYKNQRAKLLALKKIEDEAEFETSEELKMAVAKEQSDEAKEIADLNQAAEDAASAELKAASSLEQAKELKTRAETAAADAKSAAKDAEDAAKTMGKFARLQHAWSKPTWRNAGADILNAAKNTVSGVDVAALAAEATLKVKPLEDQLAAATQGLTEAKAAYETAATQRAAQVALNITQTHQVKKAHSDRLKILHETKETRRQSILRKKTEKYKSDRSNTQKRNSAAQPAKTSPRQSLVQPIEVPVSLPLQVPKRVSLRKSSVVKKTPEVAEPVVLPIEDLPIADEPTTTIDPTKNTEAFTNLSFQTVDDFVQNINKNMPRMAHWNYWLLINIIAGINTITFRNLAQSNIDPISQSLMRLIQEKPFAKYMKKLITRIKPYTWHEPATYTSYAKTIDIKESGLEYLKHLLKSNQNTFGAPLLWPERLAKFIKVIDATKL